MIRRGLVACFAGLVATLPRRSASSAEPGDKEFVNSLGMRFRVLAGGVCELSRCDRVRQVAEPARWPPLPASHGGGVGVCVPGGVNDPLSVG